MTVTPAELLDAADTAQALLLPPGVGRLLRLSARHIGYLEAEHHTLLNRVMELELRLSRTPMEATDDE